MDGEPQFDLEDPENGQECNDEGEEGSNLFSQDALKGDLELGGDPDLDNLPL